MFFFFVLLFFCCFSILSEIQFSLPLVVEREVRKLKEAIESYLADGRKGEIIRDGLHVTIMGAPNAGKSSLMNALAQRDVVIVSPQAGTTRDVVEVSLNLGGFQVHVSDTAGLRGDSSDPIEIQGISRATQRQVDLSRLFLCDPHDNITYP